MEKRNKAPWNKGSLKDLQELAKSRGWECLSKKYINNYTKYKWKCSKGHIFEMLPWSIKKGGDCRLCNPNKYKPWLGKKRPDMKHEGQFKKGGKPWNNGLKGDEFTKHFKDGKIWNKGKKVKKISRENHYNWKGGRHVGGNGYIRVRCPDHPRAKCGEGYVYEHILIMEKHLGRYLKKGEQVHHIDFNKKNNVLSNLMLFPSPSAHMKYHAELNRIFREENKILKLELNKFRNKYGK